MHLPFEEILAEIKTVKQEVAAVRQLLQDPTRTQNGNLKNPRKPLDIKGFCELTDYTKSTAYKLVHLNQVPHAKKRGKLVFFEDEIIDWIKSGKRKTLAEIKADVDEFLSKRK